MKLIRSSFQELRIFYVLFCGRSSLICSCTCSFVCFEPVLVFGFILVLVLIPVFILDYILVLGRMFAFNLHVVTLFLRDCESVCIVGLLIYLFRLETRCNARKWRI